MEPLQHKIVKQYYRLIEEDLARRNNISARESSIQLVLQLVLITHQYLYFPTSDFTFSEIQLGNKKITASSQWIFGLVLQVISVLTSGYSVFNLQLTVSETRKYKLIHYLCHHAAQVSFGKSQKKSSSTIEHNGSPRTSYAA